MIYKISGIATIHINKYFLVDIPCDWDHKDIFTNNIIEFYNTTMMSCVICDQTKIYDNKGHIINMDQLSKNDIYNICGVIYPNGVIRECVIR